MGEGFCSGKPRSRGMTGQEESQGLNRSKLSNQDGEARLTGMGRHVGRVWICWKGRLLKLGLSLLPICL